MTSSIFDAKAALSPASYGLAIFVKTPGVSPLKTRLAVGIGASAALEFHRRAAQSIAAVARAAMAVEPRLGAHWAVAEPGALAAPCWASLPRIAQGDGDLGARMQRVCGALQQQHGAALLIGADAPQLAVVDLIAACRALDRHAHVIGDSGDGGFWLFGTRVEVPAIAWTATRWSQPDTGARFVDALHSSPARLRALRDVDTAIDLAPVAQALDALDDPLPEQRALAAWMHTVVATKS